MRLTLVISSLGAGGAERVMSTLAGEWVRTGHEVTLITLADASTDFYPLEPRVHRIALDEQRPSSGLAGAVAANLRRVVRLRRAIAGSRPDAVISFMDRTNVLTLIATAGRSVRVVVSDRVDPSACPAGRTWSVLRNLLYRRADRIVCQTRAVRDWTEHATGSSRTVVIPNPVGSGFEAAGGERTRSILAMGRLVHQKGFDTLIAAFGTIAGRWPDWSLTIVGEGPERGALERMARDAGCAARVHFAGRLHDPRPVLSTASVFVLPSRFEGFPNALVEAMASGCAVVATDCPSGPAEIVEDGHDGILVPVDRSDRLVAALEALLDSEQRRVTLGAAARIAVRRFNLAAVAAQWMAVVEEDHALTPGAEAQTWVR